MNEIEFKNVCFEYNKDEPVIRELSLTVGEGEFVAVIGHNGSGKSTFAKLCNAILLPTAGRVYVAGMDTADDANTFNIRRRAGMVFQNPDNQIVATTVEEDTAFALENLGVEPAEIRRRVDSALAEVGMSDCALRSPDKLSGGQKQRVAIAGILAMQPRCIILDEPTAMLDPLGRQEVISTVARLNADGITVVLVTHYMDEAAMAGRIIVLDRGRVFADGTPREIFSRAEQLRSLGLDIPVSAALARRLKELGAGLTQSVLTPDDCAAAIDAAIKGQRRNG